jgi:hypothetical protein
MPEKNKNHQSASKACNGTRFINHATSNHRSRSVELARGFSCIRSCGSSIKTRAADETKKCLIEDMIEFFANYNGVTSLGARAGITSG